MGRTSIKLLLLIALAQSPLVAGGVNREWAFPATGHWTDPANWSPADTPDTTDETAVLDLFATYNVNLPDTPITVGGLEVANGDVKFRSIAAGPALVQVAGDAQLSGTVELQFVSAGTTFDIAGHLDIEAATDLTIDGGELNASTTIIAGGSLAGPTLVVLDNSASADLGYLSVATTADAADRAGLSAFDGSALTVRDLQLATGDDDVLGTIDVSDSTLTQTVGGVATIGQTATPGATGRGTLAVSEGGLLDLQEANVRETGKLINVGSEVRIAQRLTVDGGLYDERGAATRVLGAGATIEAINGGGLVFAGQTVTLASGQTLRLADGGEASGVEIDLAGGRLEFNAGDARVDNPVTLPSGGGVAVTAGATARFGGEFTNAGGELLVPAGATAHFEGDYHGEGATGAGEVRFEGSVNPGMSPGLAEFGGDLLWTADASHVAQLAGRGEGEYDRVIAAGAVTLDGELQIELIDDAALTLEAGDRFALIESASLAGGFATLDAPTLPDGLAWGLFQTATTLELWVVAPTGLTGDFNHDGRVDAADYTVWRDSSGAAGLHHLADANGDQAVDAADIALWRSAFGDSVPPLAAVPEPAAWLLFLVATMAKLARPGRLP